MEVSEGHMVWTAEDGVSYRIPGIVALDDGTLVAYCEKRDGMSDWADMNIEMRISMDRGESWSASSTVVAGIEAGKTINNPVMIADGARLHLIYEVEYALASRDGRILYSYSDDKGNSWSEPKTILDGREGINVFATGPGHGIKTSSGELIVPVWYVKKSAGAEEDSHHPGTVATILSKDGGSSWALGESLPNGNVEDPNESTIVELPDGSFVMNTRNESSEKCRATAKSANGTSQWSDLVLDSELDDPICFGSLAISENGRVLFVNCDSKEYRERLTLRVSNDDCETWEQKVQVAEYGGYADVTAYGGEAYILAEHMVADSCSIELFKVTL